MNSDHHHTSTWLLDSQLEPYVDAFMLHLFDCCQWPTELSHFWPLILSHFSREKLIIQL